MKRLLLCPDPDSFLAGDKLYNRRLLRALAGSAAAMEHDDWEHVPTLEKKEAFSFVLVDSHYYDRLRETNLKEKFPRAQIGMICHYLPGMETWEGEQQQADQQWAWLRDAVDFLITPSLYLKKLMRVKARYNGPIFEIPPILGKGSARRIPRAPGPLWAIMAANFLPLKGILPLLEALDKVGSEPLQSSLELTFFGDAQQDKTYSRACRKCIEQSEVLMGAVRLLPPIAPEDLDNLYSMADLYISSSFFETFGMAACESILHGTPVLAYSAGNLPDLIDRETKGKLFPDHESLARALIALSEKPEQFKEWKNRLWPERPVNRYTAEAVGKEFGSMLGKLGKA